MPIRYRFPPRLIAPRLPSLLFGHRSAYADCCAAYEAIGTTPLVSGVDCIPQSGPFIAVMNHYHRPAVPSWWFAMGMLHAIGARRLGHAPHEPRLIVARHWTYDDYWHRATWGAGSMFVVGRIIRAYGYLGMEPVALGDAAGGRRARSMRLALVAARDACARGGMLGMAPEGGDGPGGVLQRPPAGAGRFLWLLAATGIPFVPFGNSLDGERVRVSVGEPFALPALHARGGPPAASKALFDEWVLQETMGRIARLLPDALRGYYADRMPAGLP